MVIIAYDLLSISKGLIDGYLALKAFGDFFMFPNYGSLIGIFNEDDPK